MMRDNTYMLHVEVDILLHSVLVVDSYGIPPFLYLFQSLLYLVLHLYVHLDLLMAHCTEAPYYTAWGYTVAEQYCTTVAQCYIFVAQCYMGMVLH
jgi:hypothetical protein